MEIRSCQPDDLDRLLPLLDEEFIFGKGRTISLRRRFPEVFCSDNFHNIIICTDGEEIASALAMRQFEWREVGETFLGAMIGTVYTHPTRRGEGWASRLLETAAVRLREAGADFGVLWAEQHTFYARLGWVYADCGMLGEVVPNELRQELSVNVSPFSVEANASRLENIRRYYLNAMTLRRPEDYRQLPPPAERVEMRWREEQQKTAYALFGINGEAGFLYELVGDASCFPALWREVCHGRQRVFINDQIDSPSCRWISENTTVSWENKKLAMWLPLSKRVGMPRLGRWYIPYLDRI